MTTTAWQPCPAQDQGHHFKSYTRAGAREIERVFVAGCGMSEQRNPAIKKAAGGV